MDRVQIEYAGDIALIKLNSGVTNPIGPGFVRDFSQQLTSLRNQTKGVVLSGGEKFFSIGFDLPRLIEFNREEMSIFFSEFDRLVLELYSLPLPTLCAMQGHAVAGGCILASACDFRFAGNEGKKTGLNEIDLGLPVPYLADIILRQLVSARAANDLLFSGALISFSQAENIGLVDHICSAESLNEEAVEQISKYVAGGTNAFAAMKSYRVDRITQKYEAHHIEYNKVFLDCWFSDAAQEKLKEAAKNF